MKIKNIFIYTYLYIYYICLPPPLITKAQNCAHFNLMALQTTFKLFVVFMYMFIPPPSKIRRVYLTKTNNNSWS